MIKCFVFDIHGVIFPSGEVIRKLLIGEGFDEKKVIAIGGDGEIGGKYLRGEIDFLQYKALVQELFPQRYLYILENYFYPRPPLLINKKLFMEQVVDKYNINLDLTVLGRNVLTSSSDGSNGSDSVNSVEIIKCLYKNYDLCLFSGNTRMQLKVEDIQYPFLKYFKYKVFSFDIGTDKPDERFFEALINTLPYPSSECIYFDDKEDNIEIGNKLGFNSISFKSLVS